MGNKRLVLLLGLPVVIFLAKAAFAQELDAPSQEALGKTQEMLRNSEKRNEAIAKDPGMIKADENVKALMGSQGGTDQVYNLSAEIFADIARQANGDPTKMMELMDLAKRDPKAFAEKLSPEQKAKIQQMAKDVEAPRAPAGQAAVK